MQNKYLPSRKAAYLLALLLPVILSNCAALAVVDATASAAVGLTAAAAKTTGTAVGVVIPDRDNGEKDSKD